MNSSIFLSRKYQLCPIWWIKGLLIYKPKSYIENPCRPMRPTNTCISNYSSMILHNDFVRRLIIQRQNLALLWKKSPPSYRYEVSPVILYAGARCEHYWTLVLLRRKFSPSYHNRASSETLRAGVQSSRYRRQLPFELRPSLLPSCRYSASSG